MTRNTNHFLRSEGQLDGTCTVVTCNDATKINRDGDPSPLKFTDLKVGQSVRAYCDKKTHIAAHVHIAKPSPNTGK